MVVFIGGPVPSITRNELIGNEYQYARHVYRQPLDAWTIERSDRTIPTRQAHEDATMTATHKARYCRR